MSPTSRLLALVLAASPLAAAGQPYHDGRSDRSGAYGEPDIITTVGLEGQGHARGITVGATALFEGPNWGLGAQYQAVLSGGGAAPTALQLANLNVNYAVVATPVLRVRLEGGAGYAHAGATEIYSPVFGLSGAFGHLGALQLEGAVRVAPLPIRQVESSVGVALGVGRIGLRAGYKRIYLQPLEGVPELDAANFQGGYLGVAWTL